MENSKLEKKYRKLRKKCRKLKRQLRGERNKKYISAIKFLDQRDINPSLKANSALLDHLRTLIN